MIRIRKWVMFTWHHWVEPFQGKANALEHTQNKTCGKKKKTENYSLEQIVKHHCAMERNLCQNCNCLPNPTARILSLRTRIVQETTYPETWCDENRHDALLQVTNYWNLIGVMLENLLGTLGSNSLLFLTITVFFLAATKNRKILFSPSTS